MSRQIARQVCLPNFHKKAQYGSEDLNILIESTEPGVSRTRWGDIFDGGISIFDRGVENVIEFDVPPLDRGGHFFDQGGH